MDLSHVNVSGETTAKGMIIVSSPTPRLAADG
jgi:hypothetical protein